MEEAKKPRILVVEDEGIVALDISQRLEILGYKIAAVASSGDEAIKLAEELKPDLIMMDIVLKGRTLGTEAATEIHRRWQTPVIFLTAYADPEALEKAKAAEPYGYIPKPFDDTDLRIGVEIALYKAAADAGADMHEWIDFLRLLRRYRPRQPLNGVLVTVSVSDLLQFSEDQLQEHVETVRSRIAELTNELELQLPVYVVFTKCDLIGGFSEYFDDLSPQVMGSFIVELDDGGHLEGSFIATRTE